MTDKKVNGGALVELPPDLLSAVVQFRAERGRRWKSILAEGWVRAAFPGPLQQLRNQFGPEWLVRVKEAEFDGLAPARDVTGAGIRGRENPGVLFECNYNGEPGNGSHMTRRELVVMPVAALRDLKGARGEQRGFTETADGEKRFGNFSQAAWERFKADLNANGMNDPLTINIDHGKEVSIYEGNHRLQGAIQNGWEVVAVDIRYFGKAESAFEGGSFFRQATAALEEANEASAPRSPRMRM